MQYLTLDSEDVRNIVVESSNVIMGQVEYVVVNTTGNTEALEEGPPGDSIKEHWWYKGKLDRFL